MLLSFNDCHCFMWKSGLYEWVQGLWGRVLAANQSGVNQKEAEADYCIKKESWPEKLTIMSAWHGLTERNRSDKRRIIFANKSDRCKSANSCRSSSRSILRKPQKNKILRKKF